MPPTIPYFVAINAISNLDVYKKTVEVCGQDGALCEGGPLGVVPPVCEAINANLLVPGADLISVYSQVKKLDYFAGSTVCHDEGALYAGCMTSPCYRTGEQDADGNDLVQCSCPIFEGPFEIGQGSPEDMALLCDPPGNHVWSAAHNPGPNLPIDLTRPGGLCFPAVPPEIGCPLLPDNTGDESLPGSPICNEVCLAYSTQGFSHLGDDIQAVFTCDATLCTTLGLGQELPFPSSVTSEERFGLMGLACNGLGNQNLGVIGLVEGLAQCSCCASQICGCDPNSQTDTEIGLLNTMQREVGIVPQCDINGTLCGTP